MRLLCGSYAALGHSRAEARAFGEPNFQALLKLVDDGHAYVKVSAPYRISRQYPAIPTRGRSTRR
jgi:hypothetical protein